MKFIASGASPDASCLSLLALISAAGASLDARLIKLDREHHVGWRIRHAIITAACNNWPSLVVTDLVFID